jgi:hypothetical protein
MHVDINNSNVYLYKSRRFMHQLRSSRHLILCDSASLNLYWPIIRLVSHPLFTIPASVLDVLIPSQPTGEADCDYAAA